MGAAWNFMSYESKDNLLEAVRRESAGMFELAADPEVWMAPTGAGHWQVRDVFGHLIDTTETYFVGFDAARGHGDPPPLVPLVDMAVRGLPAADGIRNAERLLARLAIKSTQLEMLQTMPMDARVAALKHDGDLADDIVLTYLNRLSDAVYAMARFADEPEPELFKGRG